MNIKMAAQTIRDTVSMDQILNLYGYQTRHGFMVCPFHGDKDASLKVYPGNGGWHCFGCGKGGSVIDFVMEHEGCDFRIAVSSIDKALGLGLRDPHENPFEADAEKLRQEWLDKFAEALNSYYEFAKLCVESQIKGDLERYNETEAMIKEGKVFGCLTPHDFDFYNQWKETSEYHEDLIRLIDEFKEEVATWRRKARRVTSA